MKYGTDDDATLARITALLAADPTMSERGAISACVDDGNMRRIQAKLHKAREARIAEAGASTAP